MCVFFFVLLWVVYGGEVVFFFLLFFGVFRVIFFEIFLGFLRCLFGFPLGGWLGGKDASWGLVRLLVKGLRCAASHFLYHFISQLLRLLALFAAWPFYGRRLKHF